MDAVERSIARLNSVTAEEIDDGCRLLLSQMRPVIAAAVAGMSVDDPDMPIDFERLTVAVGESELMTIAGVFQTEQMLRMLWAQEEAEGVPLEKRHELRTLLGLLLGVVIGLNMEAARE